MTNKEVLDKLHESGVIDKRNVLWWQLGFEGRRIVTEEEFEAGLEVHSWEILNQEYGYVPSSYQLWMNNDVPILVREINLVKEGTLDKLTVDAFVTIKPLSHNWKHELEWLQEGNMEPEFINKPHIRGISLGSSDRHFFFTPITFGQRNFYGGARPIYLKGIDLPTLVDPTDARRFYSNLTRAVSYRGKSAQTKGERTEFDDHFDLVPFYEFNTQESQVMVFPTPLVEGYLDVPVVVQTTARRPYVSVVGIGGASANSDGKVSSHTWPAQHRHIKPIRKALEEIIAAGFQVN